MNQKINSRSHLCQLINRKGANDNVCGIEIGVEDGRFSKILISSYAFSKFYLLDTWKHYADGTYECACNKKQEIQDQKYKSVIEAMKPYGNKVEVIRGDSAVEFKRFPNEYFDFIYIDANHEYEYVKNDINNWYPKLKTAGVFSGHDYLDGKTKHGLFGVKSAVDAFCKSISAIPCIIKEVGKCNDSWYWIKK